MPTAHSPSSPDDRFLSAGEALLGGLKNWQQAWGAVLSIPGVRSNRFHRSEAPELPSLLTLARGSMEALLSQIDALTLDADGTLGVNLTTPLLLSVWAHGYTLLQKLSQEGKALIGSNRTPPEDLLNVVSSRLESFSLFEEQAASVGLALANKGLLFPFSTPDRASNDDHAQLDRIALFALCAHFPQQARVAVSMERVVDCLADPWWFSRTVFVQGMPYVAQAVSIRHALFPSPWLDTAHFDLDFGFLQDTHPNWHQTRIDRGQAALHLLLDEGLFDKATAPQRKTWMTSFVTELQSEVLARLSDKALSPLHEIEALKLWQEFLETTCRAQSAVPGVGLRAAQACLPQLQRLKLNALVWTDFDAFSTRAFQELDTRFPQPDAATTAWVDQHELVLRKKSKSKTHTDLSPQASERPEKEKNRRYQRDIARRVLLDSIRGFYKHSVQLGQTLGAFRTGLWMESMVQFGARLEQPGMSLLMMGVVGGSNTPPARRRQFLNERLNLIAHPLVFTWAQWARVQSEELCRRPDVLEALAHAGVRIERDNASWIQASLIDPGMRLSQPMVLEARKLDAHTPQRLSALARMGIDATQRPPVALAAHVSPLEVLVQSEDLHAPKALQWVLDSLSPEQLRDELTGVHADPQSTPLPCLAARALMPETLQLLHRAGANFTLRDSKGHGPVRWMARRSGSGAQMRMEATMLALQEGGVDWLEKDSKGVLAVSALARSAPAQALQLLVRLCPEAFSEKGSAFAYKQKTVEGSASEVLTRRGDAHTLGLVEHALLQEALSRPQAEAPAADAPPAQGVDHSIDATGSTTPTPSPSTAAPRRSRRI